MSPVQRVINIYKSNSEFSNQGSHSSSNLSSSSKKQDSSSGQSGYKNSFEKVLTDKMKKYDSRQS